LTSTDLHHFLRTRRSIRRFKLDSIPAPVIERILETTTYAPSAHNLQPWRFAIVQSDAAKASLGQALTDKMRTDMTANGASQDEIDSRVKGSLRRIDEAPVVILLCRDMTAIRKDEPEEHTMAVQSVALAGLQLMFAAHAEGLSSNWICWPLYAQEVTSTALDLPDTWEPQSMFLLGYTDDEPEKKTLNSLDDIVITR